MDHPDVQPLLTDAERAALKISKDPSSIQFLNMVPPGGAAKGPTVVANHDVRANFKDGKMPMKVKSIADGDFVRTWDDAKRKMLVMNVPWQKFRGAHVDVCTDGVKRQINDGEFDPNEPKVLVFWLAVSIVPDLGPDGNYKEDDVWGQQCVLPLWFAAVRPLGLREPGAREVPLRGLQPGQDLAAAHGARVRPQVRYAAGAPPARAALGHAPGAGRRARAGQRGRAGRASGATSPTTASPPTPTSTCRSRRCSGRAG